LSFRHQDTLSSAYMCLEAEQTFDKVTAEGLLDPFIWKASATTRPHTCTLLLTPLRSNWPATRLVGDEDKWPKYW